MILDLKKLKEIAEVEFSEIIEDVIITDINELRVILIDGSFLDIWFSLTKHFQNTFMMVTKRELSRVTLANNQKNLLVNFYFFSKRRLKADLSGSGRFVEINNLKKAIISLNPDKPGLCREDITFISMAV